jgi:ubiquinone/menaquinone biosynthesis C-methylase UbiE
LNHNPGKEPDAQISQNQVEAIYNRLASTYDAWGKLAESRARKRALELADIRDGQNILEVAVGTGLAFYDIVSRNPNGRNTGIDLSPGMLEKAWLRLEPLREKGANQTLRIGTAFSLDEKDSSIDTLVNNYMFDLIPFDEMGKILKEFHRVLKKDGKLVLVNMTKGERFGSGIYDRLYQISPKMMGGCRGVQLSGYLLQHGFKVKKREYIQQILFPSEVILATR